MSTNVKKVVKKEKREIEDSDDTVSLTESDYNEKQGDANGR